MMNADTTGAESTGAAFRKRYLLISRCKRTDDVPNLSESDGVSFVVSKMCAEVHELQH